MGHLFLLTEGSTAWIKSEVHSLWVALHRPMTIGRWLPMGPCPQVDNLPWAHEPFALPQERSTALIKVGSTSCGWPPMGHLFSPTEVSTTFIMWDMTLHRPMAIDSLYMTFHGPMGHLLLPKERSTVLIKNGVHFLWPKVECRLLPKVGALHREWYMANERGRYTTHQLCHHIPTNYLHFPHTTADSYTVGCSLVNLLQADSLGMTRKYDIREMSRSEQKERNWLPVTWPFQIKII